QAGIAHPGVAIVPVALAAYRLGQTGGRRGHNSTGRTERQRLQHAAAVVDLVAPGSLILLVEPRPRSPPLDGVGQSVGNGSPVCELLARPTAVPSAWPRWPPVGSGAERSNTPMLSRPRKPPWKTLCPSASLRLTHQVKFNRSFWKTRSRNRRSATPLTRLSILYTRQAAQACTGGLTSPNAHS